MRIGSPRAQSCSLLTGSTRDGVLAPMSPIVGSRARPLAGVDHPPPSVPGRWHRSSSTGYLHQEDAPSTRCPTWDERSGSPCERGPRHPPAVKGSNAVPPRPWRQRHPPNHPRPPRTCCRSRANPTARLKRRRPSKPWPGWLKLHGSWQRVPFLERARSDSWYDRKVGIGHTD